MADETATADADGDVPAPPPAAPQYLVNGESCTKMAEDFIAICRFKEEAPAGSYTPCSYVEKWKIGRVRCLMEGMEVRSTYLALHRIPLDHTASVYLCARVCVCAHVFVCEGSRFAFVSVAAGLTVGLLLPWPHVCTALSGGEAAAQRPASQRSREGVPQDGF